MRPAVQTVSRNQYAPFYFSGGGDVSARLLGGKCSFGKMRGFYAPAGTLSLSASFTEWSMEVTNMATVLTM